MRKLSLIFVGFVASLAVGCSGGPFPPNPSAWLESSAMSQLSKVRENAESPDCGTVDAVYQDMSEAGNPPVFVDQWKQAVYGMTALYQGCGTGGGWAAVINDGMSAGMYFTDWEQDMRNEYPDQMEAWLTS